MAAGEPEGLICPVMSDCCCRHLWRDVESVPLLDLPGEIVEDWGLAQQA